MYKIVYKKYKEKFSVSNLLLYYGGYDKMKGK